MIGLFFALGSAICFALANIYIRKAVYRTGEAYSGVIISLFLGTLVFGLWLFASGESIQLGSLSWMGVVSLAAAGIVHFLLGRSFSYIGIRLIGSNRVIPIQTCYIIIAAVLGIVFFGEPITVSFILALLLVTGGIIIISRTGQSGEGEQNLLRGALAKGILAALATAVCWGVSPVLVKFGLNELGSAPLATFISGLAATLVIGFTLFKPDNTEKLRRLDRMALGALLLASLTTAVAQIARYLALDYGTVGAVIPISATYALFFYPLSFIINRQIEDFSPRIIIGGLAVIAGIFLIFWGV
ncbi:DMT family transporter [Chloroflexota bacterium]